MSLRAENYLNALARVPEALIAGASLLPLCPTGDVVASEVSAGSVQAGYPVEAVNGIICARIASGADLYAPLFDRPRTTYSKLKLRRALRSRGLEPYFNAALDSNPTVRADWDDAVELYSDDPMMSQTVPAFATALGLSQQQVDELLSESII